MQHLKNKSILLIISGGIAAYKSLELIREIRRAGGSVRAIVTAGGAQFVTPLSVSALTEQPVYTDLWSLKDESEMGHIRLSREADLIVVAPASADLLAKMANGLADDLATTTLLAADKSVLVAPAMNHRMWSHPATQANIAILRARGVRQVGPTLGEMACNETGWGRMAEPLDILRAIEEYFEQTQDLRGRRALVTSGPTFEPLDPVRFLGNRSSGKQGHAIAAALAARGAQVTLVSGPVALADPPGVTTVHVETAVEMLAACEAALPVDIAVCAAAVADWRAADVAADKIKKTAKGAPTLALQENPDILATLARHAKRPALVIGFAAETGSLLAQARGKLRAKGCDWLVANDVAGGAVFGADDNHVHLLSDAGEQEWRGSKQEIAALLVDEIAEHFGASDQKTKKGKA